VGSTQFKLTVIGSNDAPTIVIEQSKIDVSEGNTVTLDASTSIDVDGDVMSILWEGPGDIASPESLSTDVTGLSSGTHIFTLTLSDSEVSSSQEVTVTVTPTPVAKPEPDNSKSSSGGSMGGLVMILLGIAGIRRKR